jgi:hypothetical protein
MTCSQCGLLALGIQHEMYMSHIVICGIPGLQIVFQIISYVARFSKKEMNIKIISTFSTTSVGNISHYKKN